MTAASEHRVDAPGEAVHYVPIKKWPSARQICCWIAPALIAIALSLWGAAQPPQRALFLAVNLWASQFPPAVWSVLTTLGETGLLFALLSPLLLWRPQMMFAVLAAVPLGAAMSVTLKAIFQAHRPATAIDPAQFTVIGPLLNNASFPSGHTITVFAAAVAVLAVYFIKTGPDDLPHALRPRISRWMAAVLVLSPAALVGLSRVAVGAHWPVDVLAGAGCGWLAGLSGAWLTERFPKIWQGTVSQFVLGQLLLVTALWLALRKPDYPLGVPVIWLAAACSVVTVAGQFWSGYRRLQNDQASRSSSTKARKPVV